MYMYMYRKCSNNRRRPNLGALSGMRIFSRSNKRRPFRKLIIFRRRLNKLERISPRAKSSHTKSWTPLSPASFPPSAEKNILPKVLLDQQRFNLPRCHSRKRDPLVVLERPVRSSDCSCDDRNSKFYTVAIPLVLRRKL